MSDSASPAFDPALARPLSFRAPGPGAAGSGSAPRAKSAGSGSAPGAKLAGSGSAPGANLAGSGSAPGANSVGSGSEAAGTGSEEATAPPGSLWDRMRADIPYAPEHLALEAVRRLGPEARAWAERTRAEQPDITSDALAQQAIQRFTTLARLSGAVSGATGLPGAVVDVGVLAWTQARMVLHIAAAFGLDPTAPERAIDLLVLQGVHKVAEYARLALGVAAGRERASRLYAGAEGRPLTGVMLRLGVKLAQMAGIRAAKRIFAKIVPGAAVVLGTWVNGAATTDLARRSRALYRATGA